MSGQSLEEAIMSSKQLVIEIVEGMPDEATLEETLEQLAILAAIRRGEADADAGRVIPHANVKRGSRKVWHECRPSRTFTDDSNAHPPREK
jgi:predicted transcriptional regulator